MLCYASVAKRDAGRRILDADLGELNEIRIELGLPEVPASRSSGKVAIGVVGGGTNSLGQQKIPWFKPFAKSV